MNYRIIHILLILTIIPSCKRQFIGTYTGDGIFGMQNATSSSLILLEKGKYVLKLDYTTLGEGMPINYMTELYGKYKYKHHEIILYPKFKRVNRLLYNKNFHLKESDIARRAVYEAGETIMGEM